MMDLYLISFMKRNAVVVYFGCNVNLSMKVFIALWIIQFESESFSHLLFWSSMYFFTTSKVTAPTVEMNLLRVHIQGNRLLSQANSFLKTFAVYPLICAITFITPICGFTSRSKWTCSGIISISSALYPYCSCFSSINSFNRLSTPLTKTLRRYFGQKMTWYWQL